MTFDSKSLHSNFFEDSIPLVPQEVINEKRAFYFEIANCIQVHIKKLVYSPESWRHIYDEEGKWTESKEDSESSMLSKGIFFCLFQTIGSWGFTKPLSEKLQMDFRNPGRIEYGDLLFGIDVMNNPKSENKEWRFGTIAQLHKVCLAFAELYHTIGNYSPIPWWIDRTACGSHAFNLQGFHNNVGEWWDILLVYLHWRMKEFETQDRLSFSDYLLLTCQYFYGDHRDGEEDKKLFDDLYKGNIEANEFCKRIEESDGWTAHAMRWSNDLQKRNNDIKIISLMRTNPYGVAFHELPVEVEEIPYEERTGELFRRLYWVPDELSLPELASIDKDQVEHTDKLIARLIETRGRCIMGIIRENMSSISFLPRIS